jgi:hypothetical protein
MKTITKVLLLLPFLVLFALPKGTAQSLYEITFTDARIKYKGFLVYFNEEDAYMRVGYTHQGKYNVVDVKYKSLVEQEGGYNYFIMMGSNARFITTADRGSVYNPDHFIWAWQGDYNNEKPYVTDDPHFNEKNIKLTDSYREISAKDLTDSYLKQFFRTDEREFRALQRMYREAMGQGGQIASNTGGNVGSGTNTSNNSNSSNQQQTNTNTNTNTSNSNNNSNNNQPAKMHLILVINSDIPDIGKSCETDERIMDIEFREIAKAIGIPFQKYVVKGQKFTRDNVENVLNTIRVGKNDIVVFFYSGHGFRWANQTDRYPQFDMRYSEYTQLSERTSLPFSRLIDVVKGKGARLNILLADCCNSQIGRNQFTNTTFMAGRSFQGAEIEKLRQLFLQTSGSFEMSASSPNEYAWCNINGGFFTLSFMQALKEEIGYMRTGKPNWYTISNNTVKNTQYKINTCNGCQKQTPFANVNITHR